MTLAGRDLLRMTDLSAGEVDGLLELAGRMKAARRQGADEPLLAGRTVAMLFSKASTRTRVSFEAGIGQLGGTAIYLAAADLQLARGETIEDTGRTLSRYVDAIVIRTFAQADVEALAAAADVPVVNALTDDEHPCQALADLMTARERFGRLAGLKLAYVGDGNNVCASLMAAGAMMGMGVTVASPPGYEPRADAVSAAERAAEKAGRDGAVTVVREPSAAVSDADIVYTDTFTSMGQEAERAERLAALGPYRVTAALMADAASGASFMHCLPAHRGEEVAADVIDGPASLVFDQAENRMHVQKALMAELLGAAPGGLASGGGAGRAGATPP